MIDWGLRLYLDWWRILLCTPGQKSLYLCQNDYPNCSGTSEIPVDKSSLVSPFLLSSMAPLPVMHFHISQCWCPWQTSSSPPISHNFPNGFHAPWSICQRPQSPAEKRESSNTSNPPPLHTFSTCPIGNFPFFQFSPYLSLCFCFSSPVEDKWLFMRSQGLLSWFWKHLRKHTVFSNSLTLSSWEKGRQFRQGF